MAKMLAFLKRFTISNLRDTLAHVAFGANFQNMYLEQSESLVFSNAARVLQARQ